MSAVLSVEHVTVAYGGHAVVQDVSLSLEAGQWLMLAGPNGAGKSTLIGAITQGVPYAGRILLEGRDLRAIPPRERARRLGVLEQQHSVSYAYTVEEVVSLGRYAHSRGMLGGRDEGGEASVTRALEMTGMTPLRHASMLTLSGGEVQRAFLAQVFAQEPQLLILDEPANHLDPVYQKHIFTLVRDWLKEPGRAVLSVVHDLSLARRYGTHALLLDRGRAMAQGTARDALTDDNLRSVYGMDVAQWMRQLLGVWSAEGKGIDDEA